MEGTSLSYAYYTFTWIVQISAGVFMYQVIQGGGGGNLINKIQLDTDN